MSKIAIVTDSNAGITQLEAENLGVYVIPMPFFANGKTYFEDISLSQKEFYEMLSEEVNISTSQPSIGEVTALWDKLLEQYDEIVEIPMSSGLSMACDTAKIFASEKPYIGKVHIIDNKRISVTQRESVLDAIRLVNAGKSGEEIKNILEEDGKNSSIYIMVDTLKYLKKGGRVTPAGAALGSLLGIKPILQIQGGKLDAYKKARGIKAAKMLMIEALKKDIEERFGGAENVCIAAAHSNALEEMEKLMEEIKKAIPNAKGYYINNLSLSVACHIGPGGLGITVSKILEVK